MFDAFISYSHAADGRLAPALQRAIQRLAKPWYRPRALRVFRDESALTANPHLWSSIQTALDDAEWFVLLASPDAVASEWVTREITHWLSHKSADHILVVVTDGTWEWNTAAHALTGSAVPEGLRNAFTDEPRHVDLRWAATETDLDMHHSRFRDVVAQLAAPMHGMAKDDLDSEDVRQHRRARNLARGGVSALTLLVVVSLVFGGIAVVERNDANTQRNRASERANVAIAERFAALAASKTGSSVDQALLLAVEGYRRHADSTTQAALLRTLTSEPQLVGFLPGGDDASTSTISPDGKLVVTGTAGGSVRFWDVAKPDQPSELVAPPIALANDPVVAMTFDRDGKSLYVLHDDGRVEAWDPATREPIGSPMKIGAQGALSIAASPDGRTVAVAGIDSSNGAAGETVALYDVVARRSLGGVPGGIDVAFSADGETFYTWQRFSGLHAFDVRTLAAVGPAIGNFPNEAANLAGVSDPKAPPLLVAALGHSGCSSCGASLVNGRSGRVLTELAQDFVVTAVAMNRDGTTIVVGGGDGSVTIWSPVSDGVDPTAYDAAQPFSLPLHQTSRIVKVALSADGLRLVTTAADGTTALWDLSGAGALATAPASSALGNQEFSVAGMTLSPSGTRVATVDDHLHVWKVSATTSDLGAAVPAEGVQPLGANAGLTPFVAFDPTSTRVAIEARDFSSGTPGAPFTFDGRGKQPGPEVLRGHIPAGGNNLSPYVLVVPARNPAAPDAPWWRTGRISAVNIWTGRTAGSFDPSTVTGVLRRAHRGTKRDASTFDLPSATDPNVEAVGDGFAVDSQGRSAATISNDGDVVVWDLSSGRVVGAPIISAGRDAPPASTVAFSPRGDELAVGRADGTVARYSLPSLRPVGFVLGGHDEAIGQIAYQPHGSMLAAASADEVDLFDLASGERVPVIAFFNSDVLGGSMINAAQSAGGLVQFDASGRRLLTDSFAATRPALVWSMDPSNWEGAACRAAGRNLSRVEWSELAGPGIPYHATCSQWPAGT